MSVSPASDRLSLPESLAQQLQHFRRSVWKVKLIEAVCGALLGLLAAWLALFVIDRLSDPPAWVRWLLFAGVVAGIALVPQALRRWVYGHRHFEQLARLIGRKFPSLGDQLLGVIELTQNDLEQHRSRALCEAAIRQVAEESSKRDFNHAIPQPRHRLALKLLAGGAGVAALLAAIFPAAAANAWARLLAPFGASPRYTFAAVRPLPEQVVVPHGESFALTAELQPETVRHPDAGQVQLGSQLPVDASRRDDRYVFELPAQLEPGKLALSIGDYRQSVQVQPMARPELTAVQATVKLPEYLQRPEPVQKDLRGGALALVKGSEVSFAATASRPLDAVTIDGATVSPIAGASHTPQYPVEANRRLSLEWRDAYQLAGREPFVISVTARDDEAPALAVEDLPRQKIVLDSEGLNFKLRAQDDFGVARVGMEWKSAENQTVEKPAQGEKILGAGGPTRDVLDLAGSFSAKSLGIDPQVLEVRLFVEDYLPNRPRVYSPTYTLYVLSPEEHAIWVTEQLHKWHRQSLEVRDRELQLHETNKELRSLTAQQLDETENRRKLENQASAEKANGRRLDALSNAGEELLRQASRNPELGVGHLEKWAEMLLVLKDISSNRMPSVADLLKQSAQAPQQASAGQPKPPAPQAGQNRNTQSGPGAPSQPSPPKPAVPTVVDAESQQQPPDPNAPANPSGPKKGGSSTLRLPTTTVSGAKSKPGGDKPPANESLDEAVEEQRDLLAEFDKISEELNKVLANLEGSTLVKRLKAASRKQYDIAGRLGDQVSVTFGRRGNVADDKAKRVLGEMSVQESASSQDLSTSMDDLQTYFERRRLAKVRTLLDEMRKVDVVGNLRTLADELRLSSGLAIAQAEYWSDNLDRWADDLVDAAKGGDCPGCKSRGSLPPSIVLEVMQILEAEVNLREETRVAEQAKPAVPAAEHRNEAELLSKTQSVLQDRSIKVRERIAELPEAQELFGKELALMQKVAEVMGEATSILSQPNTGNPAMAAETEAIELLLATRRIKPGGGGGGGSTPGGGGTGTTKDAAIALLGRGLNEKEVREDRGVTASSGEAGQVLPEEFRSGLDEYFNRIDSK
ncbi:MAG: hypothetical protein ACK5TO_11600 [Planctomycetaceae bacterium]